MWWSSSQLALQLCKRRKHPRVCFQSQGHGELSHMACYLPPWLCPFISSRNWEDAEPNIRRCRAAINRIPQQNGILAQEQGEENSGIITDDHWLMSNCQDTPDGSRGWVSHPVSLPPTGLMRLWKIAGYQCPAGKKDLDTMRPFFIFQNSQKQSEA